MNLNGGLSQGVDPSSIAIFTDTTNAVSPLTGALQVRGGVGIVKDLIVGGDIQFSGGSIVSGNLVASTLQVTNLTTANGVVKNDGLGNLSSSLITDSNIASATITGAKIASNTISDDKLQTISTPNKVSNSATTATPNTTPSTIVSRDASSNFSANTVTVSGLKLGSASNTVTLLPPISGTQTALTFPSSNGTSGQVLSTNGSGSLSWITASGGGSSTFAGLTDVSISNFTGSYKTVINGTSHNVFYGNDLGGNTTSGSYNANFGESHRFQGSSAYNFACGANAGLSPVTGFSNFILGYQGNTRTISGSQNIIIGTNAGESLATGQSNTCIGGYIGSSNALSSGNRNTCIGGDTKVTNPSDNEGTAIGFSARAGTSSIALGAYSVSAPNECCIGDSSITSIINLTDGNTNLGKITKRFKSLYIKSGASGDLLGTATLTGGTVAVSMPSITATDHVFLTHRTPSGTLGILSYTITPSSSITINSSSALDTSTVSYFVVRS